VIEKLLPTNTIIRFRF